MKRTKEGNKKKSRFHLPPPPGSLLIITPDYGFRPPPPRPPSGSVLFPFIDCALLLPDFAAGLLLGCGEHNGTRQRALFPLAHLNNYAFFSGILLLLLGYSNSAPLPGYPNSAPLPGYPNSAPLPGYPNSAPLPGFFFCCWATGTEDLCRASSSAAGLPEQRTFAGILHLCRDPAAGLLEQRTFAGILLLLGYRNSGPLPGSCCCWATRTADLCRDAAGLPEQRTFAGTLLGYPNSGSLPGSCCCGGVCFHCCHAKAGTAEGRARRRGKRNLVAPADPLLVEVCPTPERLKLANDGTAEGRARRRGKRNPVALADPLLADVCSTPKI